MPASAHLTYLLFESKGVRFFAESFRILTPDVRLVCFISRL